MAWLRRSGDESGNESDTSQTVRTPAGGSERSGPTGVEQLEEQRTPSGGKSKCVGSGDPLEGLY